MLLSNFFYFCITFINFLVIFVSDGMFSCGSASAAVTLNSTGFIKQGNTGGSQLAFLNRLFSMVINAHHRCGITITGPTHKRRRLIQRYVREDNYSNTCGHFIHNCAAIMNA